MARKHESFSYDYGLKYAPEQWRFYYNGKYIPLDHETRNHLALLCISGRIKEAEDDLKRLLRAEEKLDNDYVTFGFFGDGGNEYYYTLQLIAQKTDLDEKLRIYKPWKNYIRKQCKGYLLPFKVTTGFITPFGEEEKTKNRGVLIDLKRPISIDVRKEQNYLFH